MTDGTLSDEQIFMSKGDEETTTEPIAEPVAETPPETPAETPTETAETAPQSETPVQAVENPQEPVNEPVAAENAQPEAMVPSWRLREINEGKAAVEQQLLQSQQQHQQLQAQLQQVQAQLAKQQQQPPQPAPDVFADPEKWQQYQDGQFQSQGEIIQNLQAQLQNQARQSQAYAQYGFETVENAWKAAVAIEHTDPATANRIVNAPNPWAEAVKWQKEQDVQKTIGEGGIDGFRQKTREELMADPEFRKQVLEAARQEAGGAVVATPPTDVPSLSEAPRVATPENGDPLVSDAELFNMR